MNNDNPVHVTEVQDQETKRDTKSQYWVFTRNNYTDLDISLLDGLFEAGYFTYFIYGKEIGGTGTRHLQGYVELHERRRFTQIKAKLPGFYIAQRRGTAAEASEYCQKEDVNFLQRGTISRPQQGRRKDLQRVAELVKSGATIREIAQEESEAFIKYHKGIALLRKTIMPHYEPTEHTEKRFNFDHDWSRTQIFTGPTNCGKTTYAKQLLPRHLFCTHLDKLTEYDPENYDGIIFDEACFLHLPRETQIHLCDQDQSRQLHVRYMCAEIPAHTKKIFTTNKTVGEILLIDPAIERRIQVHQFEMPRSESVDTGPEMIAGGQGWRFYDCSDNIFN